MAFINLALILIGFFLNYHLLDFKWEKNIPTDKFSMFRILKKKEFYPAIAIMSMATLIYFSSIGLYITLDSKVTKYKELTKEFNSTCVRLS